MLDVPPLVAAISLMDNSSRCCPVVTNKATNTANEYQRLTQFQHRYKVLNHKAENSLNSNG